MTGKSMYKRVAALLGLATLAAALSVTSADASTISLTVNPVAQQVNSSTVIVSGTYSCNSTPQGNQGQVSATLKQGGFASLGVVNVTCDGSVHPYSVTTHGSVHAGTASYHVVLSAVPTGETVSQDGLLTVA